MNPLRFCIAFLLLLLSLSSSFAQEQKPSQEFAPFKARVNSNGVNLRCDSTVNSAVICNLRKGTKVEVVRELYDWYKIRLPDYAPSFIKTSLVNPIAEDTVTVAKVGVNIRLEPNESSAIIGKLNKDEVLKIRGATREWYRIKPVPNSFGWVHKNFIEKIPEVSVSAAAVVTSIDTQTSPKPALEQIPQISLEGQLMPYGKVFKRLATHKLIVPNNKIFLLKGDKKKLNALTYHRVKITGKLANNNGRKKYPVIEIETLEALD